MAVHGKKNETMSPRSTPVLTGIDLDRFASGNGTKHDFEIHTPGGLDLLQAQGRAPTMLMPFIGRQRAAGPSVSLHLIRSEGMHAMRYAMMTVVALVGLTALPIMARAQPVGQQLRHGHETETRKPVVRSHLPGSIVAVASQWTLAAALPSPRIGDKAQTGDYLKCAYAALAVGRNGLAQQSLEMAETRALGGPMLKGAKAVPGDIPKVFRIRDALHALGGGDRKQAIEFIKIAMLN